MADWSAWLRPGGGFLRGDLRASKIVNIAQGEVLVVGALLLWTFTLGAPKFGVQIRFLAGIVLTLLACILFGLILERLCFVR